MKIIAFTIIIFISIVAVPVFAQETFDGSKPLICASIQVFNCSPGEDCERGLPESVGAPQFLRIDLAKKEIIGPKRTAKIVSLDKGEEQIILQGVELGMGWTIALDRISGKATITFAGKREGFIVFAACTNP